MEQFVSGYVQMRRRKCLEVYPYGQRNCLCAGGVCRNLGKVPGTLAFPALSVCGKWSLCLWCPIFHRLALTLLFRCNIAVKDKQWSRDEMQSKIEKSLRTKSSPFAISLWEWLGSFCVKKIVDNLSCFEMVNTLGHVTERLHATVLMINGISRGKYSLFL